MILIRADGNARIGLGHLMRCLTIAEELARQEGREKICFVCADEASGSFVRDNGFRSQVLGTDYRDMESELPLWRDVWEAAMPGGAFAGRAGGCICREEMQTGAGGSGAGACGRKHAMVLVDSYYVTEMYLEALSRMSYTILMEDDGTCCWPVDCVINYNAPADLEAYRKLYGRTGTRLLIGSRYTPLRQQFRRPDAEAAPYDAGLDIRPGKSVSGKTETAQREVFEGTQKKAAADVAVKTGQTDIREVLITTGGGDSGNIAGRILKRIYNDDFTFHLVTGRFHPNFRELQELEKKHANIEIHHDVKDMAGLMRRCQIALTAGGSTVYELAALGVPFICFSYAENQEALVEYIGEKRIAGSAGAWHKEPEQTLERIGILFEELALNPGKRESCRRREIGMVDGEGAGRLAREILKMDPGGSGRRSAASDV